MAEKASKHQQQSAVPSESNRHNPHTDIDHDSLRAPAESIAPWAGDEDIDFTQLKAPFFLNKPQVKKTDLTKVAARKVHVQEFVRRYECEESQITYGIIRDANNRDVVYIVPPSLYDQLADFMVYAHIELLINSEGDLFFMAVPYATYQGETYEYWTSMQEAMVDATEGWVKILPNRNANRYRTRPPEVPLEDPTWPEIKWGELFAIAYKGKVLHSGHPFMRRLVGGK
jgi:hypothetical protein